MKMVTLEAMKAGQLKVLAAQALLEDWALDLKTKMIHENYLCHSPSVTSNLLRNNFMLFETNCIRAYQ